MRAKGMPILILLMMTHGCGSKGTPAGSGAVAQAPPKVAADMYKEKCGTCHFAYPPGLLPERSWIKIVDTPGGHAGGDLPLDPPAKAQLKAYLVANSAERSAFKKSQKILASIGDAVPTRISEVPYIRKKHQDIREEVFAGKAVGSRGNCIACHRGAEKGDFKGDDVVIPK